MLFIITTFRVRRSAMLLLFSVSCLRYTCYSPQRSCVSFTDEPPQHCHYSRSQLLLPFNVSQSRIFLHPQERCRVISYEQCLPRDPEGSVASCGSAKGIFSTRNARGRRGPPSQVFRYPTKYVVNLGRVKAGKKRQVSLSHSKSFRAETQLQEEGSLKGQKLIKTFCTLATCSSCFKRN